jgi:hypothetical protein
MMLPEILIGFLQISYDTMLFQTRLLHFGIIAHHSLQISLETIQIIMSPLVELIELKYSCYRFLVFLVACSTSVNLLDKF